MVNLGVAVKPDDQVQPKIRPTPDGGCYISWFDNDPNGNPPYGYDVFLQRLDARGFAQFPAGGIRIADLGMSSTQDYGLDVDPHGNALLAFLDDRRRGHITVTVAKVSPAGEQLFGEYGRQMTRSSDFLGNPKVAATSDGSIVVGWIHGNNLMFQKLSPRGAKQWGATGITVTAPSGSTYSLADLHGSDNGSVIVSWVSAAGFTSPKHLLANKLGTDGSLLWGADHVTVFDGGSLQFGNFPPFVTDGAGGAVFGWYEVSPLQSRAQHILADGSEAFPHNGTPGSTNTADNQVNPSVSYDPATGSTYLFWDEQLPGPLTNEGISAQKFDAAGVAQWGDYRCRRAAFHFLRGHQRHERLHRRWSIRRLVVGAGLRPGYDHGRQAGLDRRHSSVRLSRSHPFSPRNRASISPFPPTASPLPPGATAGTMAATSTRRISRRIARLDNKLEPFSRCLGSGRPVLVDCQLPWNEVKMKGSTQIAKNG